MVADSEDEQEIGRRGGHSQTQAAQEKTTEQKKVYAQNYEELQTKMNYTKEAYNCMMGATAQGCLGRVLYDPKCDLIIISW